MNTSTDRDDVIQDATQVALVVRDALAKVKSLLKLNDREKYEVVPGQNPSGEIIYRYLNARDIYERRLIPYN